MIAGPESTPASHYPRISSPHTYLAGRRKAAYSTYVVTMDFGSDLLALGKVYPEAHTHDCKISNKDLKSIKLGAKCCHI